MTASLKTLGTRGIFQHDNDPKHTAKITQGIKSDTITWPRMPPDSNLIKHVWDI